jgi:hypothetical protein
MTVFREMKSLQPAPLLNVVVHASVQSTCLRLNSPREPGEELKDSLRPMETAGSVLTLRGSNK